MLGTKCSSSVVLEILCWRKTIQHFICQKDFCTLFCSTQIPMKMGRCVKLKNRINDLQIIFNL